MFDNSFVDRLKPHERPMLPGSPATPEFPWHIRAAYAAVGVCVGTTGTLGMALVTVNLSNIQGSLGLSAAEAAWLPTAYLMTYVSMNLLLVKFRQQFGLRLFGQLALWAYVAAIVGHLFVDGFASALLVRAASGAAGAALTALCLFYLLQALPAKWRLSTIVLAISLPTIATPAARLLSPDILEFGGWRTLYVLELGLALLSLGGVLALRLPPSQRFRLFERMDFVTYPVLAVGLGLLCAVLGLGKTGWWLDTPWLGLALAVSIALLTVGAILELRRSNPLLDIHWIFTPSFVGFALMVGLTRVIVSEQTYAAVGLMQAAGMSAAQLQDLFLVVTLATLAGVAVSALTISQKTALPQIASAIILIGLAGYLDSQSSNVTRPEQIYLTQAMVGFAAALFIGPALLIGIAQVLQNGTRLLTTVIVMFGLTQNLGGLIGSSFLSTYQATRFREHYARLAEMTDATNAIVSGQLAANPASAVRRITQEANVLAFNDVFAAVSIVAVLAFITAVFFAVRTLAAMRAQQNPGGKHA